MLIRETANLLVIFALGGVFVANAGSRTDCDDATTLLVVRHADRAGKADSLSAAGVERARALVQVAARASVDAIYHSDTARTRLTAEPLAQAFGITPVELPGNDVDGLVQHVFDHHCGGTVVIVAHSNTVPLIVAAFGGPEMPPIAEDDFDDLFVLAVVGRTATFVKLQYGAPTP